MKLIQFFALTTSENYTAGDYERPLLERIWEGFRNLFIESDEYYEYLTVDVGTLLSVRLIILGLFIGMCFATFASVYNKKVLGDVVRKILSQNALSPETALTVEELGYQKKLLTRYAFKNSTSLRRVVKSREEVLYYQELENKRKEYLSKKNNGEKIPKFKEIPYKMDVTADHFYIPEDMKYMADIKFDKKGASWLSAVLLTVILTIAFFVIMYFLPDILGFINDLAAGFQSTGNKKIL